MIKKFQAVTTKALNRMQAILSVGSRAAGRDHILVKLALKGKEKEELLEK